MIEVEEMKNLYRDEFETVFGVKKNIKALRDKVLDLAFKGALVEQDQNDESGKMLFQEIQNQKKWLLKEKKIKNIKNYPSITSKDIPYKIPESWRWVRLGEIGNVTGGGTPKTNEPGYWKDGDIPWVSPVDLSGYKDKYISSGRKNITKLGLEKSSAQLLEEGSVLFSSRAPIGYVAIAKNPIATNQGFKSITPYIKDLNAYIYYYFFAFIEDIKSRSSGTTFKEISGSELGKSLFPLPPLPEQKRIVMRIESLMQQIDQLEEQLEQKEKLEVLIPKAVVTALSNSQDEEELKKNLAMVIENFTEVFQTPESLEEFRNVVLRLAFQGRLLPQETINESAHALLKKIQEETNSKKKASLKKGEILFEIPENWIWTNLEDIAKLTMGQSPPGSTVSEAGNGIEFHQGKKNFGDIYLKPSGQTTSNSKKVVDENTLLLSVRAPVGNLNITPREISIGRGLCGINGHSGISSKFLYYFIQNLQPLMEEKSTGTTFKAISGVVIKKLPIPLPPLEEQKRIVAKIESLFAVVDKLEEEMKRRKCIVEAMAVV